MLSNMSKLRIIKNVTTEFTNKQKPYFNTSKPILFDVSLRDGMQGIKKTRQNNITLEDKINVFHSIVFNYAPKKIEVGSIVNPKILPIMADSIPMYHYATKYIKNSKRLVELSDIYMVVPNKKAFDLGVTHGIRNFSFLTSVSNSFQKKNINKTVHETKKDLTEIFKSISISTSSSTSSSSSSSRGVEETYKTKLYISCINACPFEGIIDNDVIVNDILTYHAEFPLIDEFCLSDTCGSLKHEDYEYIIDACIFFGLPPSKISLHLHVNKENISNVQQIIFHSLDNNIIRFDVSLLETGGCSITLPSSKLLPNLSYEMFNKIYAKYRSLRS